LASFDLEKPLDEWPPGRVQQLLTGDGKRFRGLLLELEIEWAAATRQSVRDKLSTYRGEVPCPDGGGTRLGRAARTSRVGGRAIYEVTQLTVAQAIEFFPPETFPSDKQPIATPLVTQIEHRLRFLDEVGLAYLSLDRRADTLSG